MEAIGAPFLVLDSERFIRDGAVVFEREIIDYGPLKRIKKEYGEVEYFENSIIVPGFINMHTHSPMSLLRGYADDMPLMKWLKEKIWPLEAKMEEKHYYVGAKLSIIEMLRSGTTCMLDMYFKMHSVAKACEELNFRAFLAEAFFDWNFEEALKTFEKERKKESELVRYMLGPHAPYTCSPETLRRVREVADELGVRVHIHVAETKEEMREIRKKYGVRARDPVHHLWKLNFLKDDVILAHVVWPRASVKLLKLSKATVVHCPSSNLKLASGIAPVRKMIAQNVNVALGTDSAASNNNVNMLIEMRLSALIAKVLELDATSVSARNAFRMATEAGARALGLKAGRIEKGYVADIAVISCQNPPVFDPYSYLVYSSSQDRALRVYVGGKRSYPIEDEEKIKRKALKAVEELTG